METFMSPRLPLIVSSVPTELPLAFAALLARTANAVSGTRLSASMRGHRCETFRRFPTSSPIHSHRDRDDFK
jgi:hypothetical protein